MRKILAIVLIFLSVNVFASTSINVFELEIKLPENCEYNVWPNIVDKDNKFWCGESSINFQAPNKAVLPTVTGMKIGNHNLELENYTAKNLQGKTHIYFSFKVRNDIWHRYFICDEIVCVISNSKDLDFNEKFMSQITSELLYNKPFKKDK
tara:strand:+ start:62 stop:514 length:453 start_codon:yes stop_codon:yes gene_type:complete